MKKRKSSSVTVFWVAISLMAVVIEMSSSLFFVSSLSLDATKFPSPKSISPPSSHINPSDVDFNVSRRDLLAKTTATAAGLVILSPPPPPVHAASAAAPSPTAELLSLLRQADAQMEAIPRLIEEEKWDRVRAVLITPPLSDCREKKSLLPRYAEALGDAGGDELAALEAKEELQGHLRYLDMAVYNNNFNPITVEGTTNASPGLIRSYYEDPINEYTASRKALQELIGLARDL
jgi:hypothetical protein